MRCQDDINIEHNMKSISRAQWLSGRVGAMSELGRAHVLLVHMTYETGRTRAGEAPGHDGRRDGQGDGQGPRAAAQEGAAVPEGDQQPRDALPPRRGLHEALLAGTGGQALPRRAGAPASSFLRLTTYDCIYSYPYDAATPRTRIRAQDLAMGLDAEGEKIKVRHLQLALSLEIPSTSICCTKLVFVNLHNAHDITSIS